MKPFQSFDESPDSQFRKLFIGNLGPINEIDLRQFYQQFGEITDAVVMAEKMTGKPRGFGFITYASEEELDKAMANRPHVIDGRTVDPKRAIPRDRSVTPEAGVSTTRLYVNGIKEGHTEQMLKDYFQTYGNVLKVDIVNDKTSGKPRGFAFVNFDDFDPVDKCALHRHHQINGRRCDVKKALSKEQTDKAQQMADRAMRSQRSRGNERKSNGRGSPAYPRFPPGVSTNRPYPWTEPVPYNGPYGATLGPSSQSPACYNYNQPPPPTYYAPPAYHMPEPSTYPGGGYPSGYQQYEAYTAYQPPHPCPPTSYAPSVPAVKPEAAKNEYS